MTTKLDPWDAVGIEDYSKLFEEFGISPFEDLLPKIPKPQRYMRRRIIFGHRSYDLVLNAMVAGKPFGAMSGFMPSGRAHLGHKMVMEELVWHQKMGGEVFMAIADMEAHSVRGVSWEECRRAGIGEYILSAIALGFEPGVHFYFQSDSPQVKNLAFELGIKANFSELSSIYGFNGETNISHMISALTQSADILQPQLVDYGGPKPVVIPVGADQDPHIRLTRGLAYKVAMFIVELRKKNGHEYVSVRGKGAPPRALKEVANLTHGKLFEEHVDVFGSSFGEVEKIAREVEIKHGGYGFLPPASTYHKFMSGLQGGKMSSSVPESYIALTDPPEVGANKVMRAKTGGKVFLEEQRRLGGEPEACSVFELFLFHLTENDEELVEIYGECKAGKRTCGPCKAHAAELLSNFLREHQEKMRSARERLGEYGVIQK